MAAEIQRKEKSNECNEVAGVGVSAEDLRVSMLMLSIQYGGFGNLNLEY